MLLQDVAPPQLLAITVDARGSDAADLEVGEASLALHDKGSTANPVLVQQPMTIIGRLPTVVKFKCLP